MKQLSLSKKNFFVLVIKLSYERAYLKLAVFAFHRILLDHLLRPGGTSPPCFSCGVVSIEKDKFMTPAHSLKTTRSSHSAQYCRHQTYSDALKNSFSPLTIPHWNSLSIPSPLTPYLNKNSAKSVFVFLCFFLLLLFSFFILSKFQN